MRPLLLSLGFCILVLGACWAQNTDEGANTPQLPVGQTFKQFIWPVYQDGKLKATLSAVEATGMTLNRAETTDLKIEIYDTVTTIITSPKADLYAAEQKLRTKNTVLIERPDMTASAQACDFDLKTKKYLLRNNVRVVLKHFDLSPASPAGATPAPAPASTTATPGPPGPKRSDDSLLESPGSYADTNSAPTSPTSPITK